MSHCPNRIWLTEFAPNVPSVKFLNQAMTFLDKTPEVVRYAYFGAFEGSLMTESGGLSSLGQSTTQSRGLSASRLI